MNRTAHSLAFLLLLCVPAIADTITGRVVGVTDGDTITILDASNTQHKVRLNGIDAPEKGQDFGQAAKRHLSDLIFNRQVSVDWRKVDRYGRIIGKVTLDGQDINLVMIRAGFAWYFRRYERDVAAADRGPYAKAEAEARERRRGLWATPDAVAPWEWRAMKRAK